MAAIAELLFATELLPSSLAGLAAMPEAVPTAPDGQFGNLLLENLQQYLALTPEAAQAALPMPELVPQVQSAANLTAPEMMMPANDLSVIGQVSILHPNEQAIASQPLLVSVTQLTARDTTQSELAPSSMMEKVQTAPLAILSQPPAMPATIITASSPALATHVQVEFLPAAMVAGNNDAQNWQLLIPTTNWQLLIPTTELQPNQLDKTTLPVLVVAEQPTSAPWQPTMVLPAVLDASNLELPKLLNSLKQLLTQVQQPLHSDGASVPEDVESIAALPNRLTKQTILPQSQIAPEVISALKPVLISAKLTIDAAALESAIRQIAAPLASDSIKLAPAATALLPTSAPLMTQPQVLVTSEMPPAAQAFAAPVVVATDGAATAFFDFDSNSRESFAGLPKQEGETVVQPLAATDSQIEDLGSISKQIERLDNVERIENIDRMRIQFSQAQLRTLVQRGEIKLHLSPPELGEMRVELRSVAEGVTARFEVRSEAARQIIEINLPHLRESMERAGIRVDQFEVFVAGDDQRRRAQQQTEQQQEHESVETADAEPESAPPQRAQLLHLGRVNLIA